MQSQEQEVLAAARAALQAGGTCWLATVIGVHGSSPRPPGSMALFTPPQQTGSLSGGCVEEELLRQLVAGEFSGAAPQRLRYGVSAAENARLGLPCGGHLDILLQALEPERDLGWIQAVLEATASRRCLQRSVALDSGATELLPLSRFSALSCDERSLRQCFGPRQRMLLVGAGALAARLAELALALDYDVRVCDPRDEARADWSGPALPLLGGMPDDAVREFASDEHSLVITLTHDPRIDDMALMEALESRAWYVGALGSVRTTVARRERLLALGLPPAAVDRLHAPVGLDIGSKAPLEIAIAVMAQIIGLRRRTPEPP
ncbi:MAG: XdhC family protein [Halieaceae bacterium]|jgi:xanthine dehydrogenase accessory factor|nr:XdhC family protein [Halieaceae bacterium]